MSITKTRPRPPRIAVRAILLHDNRLLLVNAWQGRDNLFCAPGGGVEPHSSLPDNLAREVFEECGLKVDVGAVCLVNEFHDPDRAFHQIEIFFRCTLVEGDPEAEWTDPEGVVSQRRWVREDEMSDIPHRPASLASVAWGDEVRTVYDPLERLWR